MRLCNYDLELIGTRLSLSPVLSNGNSNLISNVNQNTINTSIQQEDEVTE